MIARMFAEAGLSWGEVLKIIGASYIGYLLGWGTFRAARRLRKHGA